MTKNNDLKNDNISFENGLNEEEIDFIFPDDEEGDPNHKFS